MEMQMEPDGPEQREAERLEDELAADRRHEIAEARADEDYDRNERREEFRDLMIAICRPSCTLIGHQRHETKPYCRFCGALV
jgi:hypothetical protein